MVSTPTAAAPAAAGVVPPRPAASYATNLTTTLLGLWTTIGLLLDVWAHNNVPELETFFTPWHAVFYSGFAATAGWIAWTTRGALGPGRRDPRAIPVGYASAAIAVLAFGVAAVADLTWHTIFGIEQDIDILFSPSHLALVAALLVIVTAPARSAWSDPALPAAPGLRRLLPTVLALWLSATMVLVLLQYANALTLDSSAVVVAMSSVNQGRTASLAEHMVITTLVVLAPLLTMARRWVLPFGAATVGFTIIGGLSASVTDFDNLPLIIGFLGAGVCADLLALWLRPTADRLVRYRGYAALVPLVMWVTFLLTAYATAPATIVSRGVPDPHPEGVVELYTGIPLAQALIGLLLATILVPSRQASRPE